MQSVLRRLQCCFKRPRSRMPKITLLALLIFLALSTSLYLFRRELTFVTSFPNPGISTASRHTAFGQPYLAPLQTSDGSTKLQSSQVERLMEQLLLESEGIWKNSVKRRNDAIKSFRKMFFLEPWQSHGDIVFWDLFAPYFHCPRPVERVGRLGDGGKWVCAFTHISTFKSCIIYSFGIRDEISFEKEVLERTNCTVKMFDPSIDITTGPARSLVHQYPGRAFLQKIGLGGKTSGDLRSLKDQMELEGDTFIDILKADIEGSEWAAFSQAANDFGVLPFGQLLVECHLTTYWNENQTFFKYGKATFYEFKKWMEILEGHGLRAFHFEPNELPLIHKVHTNKVTFNEYSFLNLKLLNGSYFS